MKKIACCASFSFDPNSKKIPFAYFIMINVHSTFENGVAAMLLVETKKESSALKAKNRYNDKANGVAERQLEQHKENSLCENCDTRCRMIDRCTTIKPRCWECFKDELVDPSAKQSHRIVQFESEGKPMVAVLNRYYDESHVNPLLGTKHFFVDVSSVTTPHHVSVPAIVALLELDQTKVEYLHNCDTLEASREQHNTKKTQERNALKRQETNKIIYEAIKTKGGPKDLSKDEFDESITAN